MRNGSDLIGMPVTAKDTGKVIGRVKDVIVSRKAKCILGFLLQHACWFKRARVIPLSQSKWLAEESIEVSSEEIVTTLDNAFDEKRLTSWNEFLGLPLMSTNGHEFGTIHDICFHDHSGEINGFAVRTWYLPDDLPDSVFLPLNDDIVIRRSSILVGEEATDRLMFEAAEKIQRDTIHQTSIAHQTSHRDCIDRITHNGTDNSNHYLWNTTDVRLSTKIPQLAQNFRTFW